VEPVHRIAILVPAYKEDGIILSTAVELTKLDYPCHLYDVYIIADSFKEETLKSLEALSVNIIKVSFSKSTKSRALNAAMSQITENYDIALICDADNIFKKDFLIKTDEAFTGGCRAIQGQRVAKNLDSNFSILDGISEMINNQIFRKGHTGLGLSSSVIGSGMAFSYDLLKDAMKKIDVTGGFDKLLQLEVVKLRIPIVYIENALVFDEKVSNAGAFQRQRSRWISSQFLYLKKYFIPGLKMLFKGNIDYFNLAVMHNLILPRVIILGILPVLWFLSLLLDAYVTIAPSWWLALSVMYCVSLLLVLPKAFYRKQFIPALVSLPKAFCLILIGFLRAKQSNKNFIHTIHDQQKIVNPIYTSNEI